MACQVTFTCDVCSTVRGLTNNWYLARTKEYQHLVITVIPFDYDMAREGHYMVLCGENCVHTFISQNLSTLHNHAQEGALTNGKV